MMSSQPSYTVADLRQAARTAADGFKKKLSDYIAANDRHRFEVSKLVFDNALFGMGHLLLTTQHFTDENVQFQKYVGSLQEEIRAIVWPDTDTSRD